MLAVSGVWERRMYGPGTLDESHRRRSIYFKIKRSKLIPMMQLFDMPEPLVSVGRRPTTTIAPQALLLMNNPHVRNYARGFGKLVAVEKENRKSIDLAYRMALARAASDEEMQNAIQFLARQSQSYLAGGKREHRLLALHDFCHVLFCLNEFVYMD